MAKQAILVTYRVKPGRMHELLPKLRTHIERTRAQEPGCVQFDAMLPRDEPDTVHLHEVYADESALAAHNASDQLASYKAESAPLLDDRVIVFCTVDE